MKKLFLLIGICFSMSLANAQETLDPQHSFQDSHHNVICYVRNATLFDKSYAYMGQFTVVNKQYSVLNSHHQPIGSVIGGKEVKDANNQTVGFISINHTDYVVTFEDAQHNAVGFIKPDGTVENKTRVPPPRTPRSHQRK